MSKRRGGDELDAEYDLSVREVRVMSHDREAKELEKEGGERTV